MTTHVSGHSDLRSAGDWRCWRCWRAPGSREPPSPLSAALRANNISSSAPRSPSCAARSRCEGRRSTRQPGSLFPSEPPWLACPGWRLAALGNFGSPCRTSFRRGCKKSSVFSGRYSQQSCVLLFFYFFISNMRYRSTARDCGRIAQLQSHKPHFAIWHALIDVYIYTLYAHVCCVNVTPSLWNNTPP